MELVTEGFLFRFMAPFIDSSCFQDVYFMYNGCFAVFLSVSEYMYLPEPNL